MSEKQLRSVLRKTSKNFDINFDDKAHVPGDFALIQKQIRNGIITSDILETIRAVASNVEQGDEGCREFGV